MFFKSNTHPETLDARAGKKVFVGLSGGVDSSVTAALLKKRGFDVTGVYIKGWYPDWKECNWKDARRDAMRVAAKLSIPFQTLDMSEMYKRDVVDYFLSEYKKGRTPNPDVMCNKYIKFGGFYDWAIERGADFVATGHYARIEESRLLRGKDTTKDQSYFLWTLKKEQLEHVLFPLGVMEKRQVRKLAKKFDLPTSTKKDSQGICFLEDISMEEFLRHYFPTHKGKVFDETGAEIGEHDGSLLYTIGQRHGFITKKESTNEQPYFVISKDLEKNIITVSHEKAVTRAGSYSLEQINWLTVPEENKRYLGQTRYRQKPSSCSLVQKESSWTVAFEKNAEKPVSGQSFVVYEGDRVVGGGILT